VDKSTENPKKNLGESIRQRLKNLSKIRNRPFDEILRYYAIERFLYRLSISTHAEKFFLKGGLMLKVWDSMSHRATMDIDLLARTSNQIQNLHKIISDVATIPYEEDAIAFDTQNLILRNTQTTGDYNGVSASFSAKLFTTKIPILIDIGFNDIIIPEAQKIQYPTLLRMPEPTLWGYTLETVIAEKLEAIVKLALVNTRMKDFYDLWTIIQHHEIQPDRLRIAITDVFANRGTTLKHPIAFTPAFYEAKETQQRWNNFLSSMGKEDASFKDVIHELSKFTNFLFEKQPLQ
jgi:predicted nucleotidyltransferase component of viral defense system